MPITEGIDWSSNLENNVVISLLLFVFVLVFLLLVCCLLCWLFCGFLKKYILFLKFNLASLHTPLPVPTI